MEGGIGGLPPQNRFKVFHNAPVRSWGLDVLAKDWNAYEAQVDGGERRLR